MKICKLFYTIVLHNCFKNNFSQNCFFMVFCLIVLHTCFFTKLFLILFSWNISTLRKHIILIPLHLNATSMFSCINSKHIRRPAVGHQAAKAKVCSVVIGLVDLGCHCYSTVRLQSVGKNVIIGIQREVPRSQNKAESITKPCFLSRWNAPKTAIPRGPQE